MRQRHADKSQLFVSPVYRDSPAHRRAYIRFFFRAAVRAIPSTERQRQLSRQNAALQSTDA